MSLSPSLLPSLRISLAIAVLATGGLALIGDADARPGGKKGWSKRLGQSETKARAKRGGGWASLSRSSARTRVAAPSASAPRPESRPRAVTAPAPAPRAQSSSVTRRTEVTSAVPAPKRGGLLVKLFGSSNRSQAAARVSSSTGLRRVDQSPPVPRLAPGQPNANQSAPKIDHALIAKSSKSQSSVTVNIARQRAYVYIGGKVAVDTPISTARRGKYTPRGSFRVGERVHNGKISTIYKVEMPRWMRLGSTPYGMHAGYLPGYPASAGCIRMPFAAADAVYKATGYGTRVKIISG